MTFEQHPKGWAARQLKDVAEIQRKSVAADKIKSGTKYVGLEHIDSSGSFTTQQIVQNGELASTKFIFGPEHLLYGKLRPYLKKIARPHFSGVCSTDILPIFPNKEVLDRNFLYYYLRQTPLVNLAAARSIGANLPRLSPKTLGEFPVFLPPLSEQKRIVAILDKADVIRRKRLETISLSDTFLRSVFLKMFGDPVTNPRGWDEVTIDEHTEFMTSGSRGWARYYSDFGAKFIRIQNVRDGFLSFNDCQCVAPPKNKEAERTRVREKDLLLSITADLGRTAVVDKETARNGAYINQHLALLRLDDKVEPDFLSAYLESQGGRLQFKRLDQVGVKSGLNFNAIKSMKFYRPPQTMQKKYSNIKAQYKQKMSSKINASLAEANNLFSSLQQRAFRGDL
jgi:type I restriction enzyme, S subunit